MAKKVAARADWRGPFLRALAAGAGVNKAVGEADVSPSTAYKAKRRDPAFATDWLRAVETGRARLLTGGTPALAADEVVRRSSSGKPFIASAGPARWSAGKETRFLDALATTANVRGAAAAVGTSPTAVYKRRREWPGFAERWRDSLEQGWARLEAALVRSAADTLEGVTPDGDVAIAAEDGGVAAPPIPAMTVDQAITLWRLHRHDVTGEGRRPRHDWRRKEPSLEQVRDDVLRRLRALGG